MGTHSYLPVMFDADPQPRLTPESIRQAEQGAAAQTRETDAINDAKRRERGGDYHWKDELAQLERRFASVGTIGSAGAYAASRSAELDEEVAALEKLQEQLEAALPKGVKLSEKYPSTLQRKLEKIIVALDGARRRQEAAKAQGQQAMRCAEEFRRDGLMRLYELREKLKAEEQLEAQLKAIR
jgi:hypothetical protein